MKKSVVIGIVILVIVVGLVIIMYVGKECKTDADCLTKNCFTVQCRKNNCIYLPIINCCGNEICEVNETYPKCAVDCPSCDDFNNCTIDKYDYHEQECVNNPIIPCCGNGICDENAEIDLNCSADCPNCDDDNKLTTDSFNYATQKCENPVTHYFIDDFEEGTENWVLNETVWGTIVEDGNTVLKGKEHGWAKLQGMEWDNYGFKFRFKYIKMGIHVNFRVNENGRYFFGGGDAPLKKQFNDGTEIKDLISVKKQIEIDKSDWHTFEIRCYGNIFNIYINDELLIKYKDTEDPFLFGGVSFETFDNSEFLIDDVEIKLITEEDIIYP